VSWSRDFSIAPNWQLRAACRGLGANNWVRESGQGSAEGQRDICRCCPVRHKCLAFAMAELSLPGLWGGTDERERLAMQLSEWLSRSC
jgi:WhiB family redox-sensing transcriptional regulator